MPKVKARRTARHLFAYSLGLLALAVLAQREIVFAFLAALYSPLVHEWVIHAARASERKGVPVFSGRETMVLDVHPDSPAAKAGIEPGRRHRRHQRDPGRDPRDLAEAMEPWALKAEIEVENGITGQRRILHCPEKIPPLGVILVPHGDDGLYLELREKPRWRRLLERWGRRRAPRFPRR